MCQDESRSPRLADLLRFSRMMVACCGVVLSLLSGWLAGHRPADGDFTGLLALWLAGVLAFLLAFVPPLTADWREQASGWMHRHRLEIAAMAALLLGALAARTLGLDRVPRNFGGDEGTWGLEGLAMFREGGLANPFTTGWFGFPSMSFLASGVSMKLFGETVAGLRALPAVIGTATVLGTFLLARELWSPRVAWMAAVLLAGQHYHIHYSRLAYNNVADGLFVTTGFWLLARGFRTHGRGQLVLSGALLGLSWYGYVGARLITVIMAAYLCWRAVAERGFLRRHAGGLTLMLAAAVVVLLPLGMHFLGHPDDFLSRQRQVSIFASGWLENERLVTGRGTASLMAEQAWKSVSAFHHTVDPTFIYGPGVPLLDVASGVLMIIGLAIAAWRLRSYANVLLLLWFWLAVVFGWMLTENPPSSQRLVIAAPALAILSALGMEALVARCRRLLSERALLCSIATAVILGGIVAWNLSFYFLTFTPRRIYGNPTAEIATVWSEALLARRGTPPIYFDAAPFMYWDFGTLAFRLRGFEGMDWSPDAGIEIDARGGALFFVHEAKLEHLAWIEEHFPGGKVREYHSDADGRLMFVTYEIPPRAGRQGSPD